MKHLHLLIELKFKLIANALRKTWRRSRLESFTLLVFMAATGTALFFFFWHGFGFFRAQEPFGPILIDETFYLLTFAMFLMLFISSAVASYTSLFRSEEVPFLLTHSVRWGEIYFVKLGEAMWFSSWAFLFIAVPFMSAYGLTKQTPFFFPILCLLFFLPLIFLAGTLGTLTSTLMVWMFPNRKRKRLALIAGIVLAALSFIKAQPEMMKEQGSIAGVMSGYLPHIAVAKNPLVPSAWATRGILALSTLEAGSLPEWKDGVFYFLLLLSNALFSLIPSYSVATKLFPRIYLIASDHAESQTRRRLKFRKDLEKFLDKLPWPPRPVMAFLEKDVKFFLRDPAEWSQMIIFFGLLLLYFGNLKNLEFHILKDFWKNIVFVLNTVGVYIVLSSFNMRFVFPMLSLEGTRFWIIRLSPIRFSQLLLEKFFLGTFFSALLSLPLVYLSGWMLEIPFPRILLATGLGFFVCLALTGLSVGFGARFPNFKSTNPTEIISGFGGSLLLIAHLGYLALIGLFLMYSQNPHWLILGFVAAFSLLVGTVPLKMGIRNLRRIEY